MFTDKLYCVASLMVKKNKINSTYLLRVENVEEKQINYECK